MRELFNPLLDWYLNSLQAGGFPLVALLMAVESSIMPLPSEVVIPPAAHLAWSEGMLFFGGRWQGWPAMFLLVLAGTVGSWLGATAMYWGSRWAGRPLVLRYGKYFFIPAHKVEGAECWAATYGPFGIFASRLLPVVRHLIGIPAGIVRLNYWQFSLYTLLGSAIWSGVLCWLGVQVGAEISHGQMQRVSLWLIGFLLLLGLLYYFFVHRQMRGCTASGSSGSN